MQDKNLPKGAGFVCISSSRVIKKCRDYAECANLFTGTMHDLVVDPAMVLPIPRYGWVSNEKVTRCVGIGISDFHISESKTKFWSRLLSAYVKTTQKRTINDAAIKPQEA